MDELTTAGQYDLAKNFYALLKSVLQIEHWPKIPKWMDRGRFLTMRKVTPAAPLMASALPLEKRTGRSDQNGEGMPIRPTIAIDEGKRRGAVSEPVNGSVIARVNDLWIIRRWAGNRAAREFVRYLFAGGIAFIGDASTLFSLTQFLGVNYLISAVFGFIVGVTINYLICRNWVFRLRRLKNTTAEMGIFTVIGVVGLGMNELILWTFQAKLGIYYMFAKGVSGVVVLGWNFSARKLALFR